MMDNVTHTHEGPDPHAPRPDHDDTLTHHKMLEIAVRELLIEKGILTADEIREAVERMDARGPHLGAKLVAKAWVDPAFKTRLVENGSTAAEEAGVQMDQPTRLIVVENTPQVHNLVVCTLCSCYPRMVLGIPPDWYKSRAYRSRAV
ncbi:MAG TPA: nitrile hydratase subunit alpha, partial [Reyranella sp.]|nr:nitrile hydratase subunit alpha [Reyranella sp.]